MTEQKNFRWGMIGCGDVTEVKSAPAYHLVDGFELCAVMARTPGKAKDYAQRHRIAKFYTDADALINDPEIDCIYIATPPDSHSELALKVAEAGKPCCVEKPMALNYAQCCEMQQAFESRQLPFFVAYYRRSLPAFLQIKQWIGSGKIGNIRHIDWQYSRPPSLKDLNQQPNWRTQIDVAPGGYFDDLASHGLDMLTFLAGRVSQVNGFVSHQQNLYSAPDAVVCSMLFESGATATGNWNFTSYLQQDKVTVLGQSGSIEFSIFGDQPARLVSQSGSEQIPMAKPDPIQQPFVQAMADHLAGKSVHPSLADGASHTSWIMDAILA